MRSDRLDRSLYWTRLGGAIVLATLAACGVEERTASSAHLELLAVARASGGEARRISIDGETRPAVVTPARGFEWQGRIPDGARLHVGAQILPERRDELESADLVISAESLDGREVEVLAVAQFTAVQPEVRWFDANADLGGWSGRDARLRFIVRPIWRSGATPRDTSALVAWSPASLEGAVTAAVEAVNVLFILVDTLRADHLGAYGYARATTPEIDRRLAAEGVVFERAYAQAPWTLPSVASLFVGVEPGRFLGGPMGSFGLPEDPQAPTTLPELFATRGYVTGGFIANPTLHAGNGFARGFSTFYNPPLDIESMKRHADDLTPRVQAWLRAHQRRPFFLYAHYLDPHDPYLAPDLVANRSQFLPEYDGPVTGDWVHGVYNGRLTLPDPARDIPQLVALYDSEVRYVDRHVGRLLDTLEPDVLRRTLVVLTSDHGEELFEHGGWKHGQTLYEEQIRVPLILRWDGRIGGGRREGAPVALLDLLPTLAAAAGVEPQPHWSGVNLLDGGGRGGTPARRAIFSQHLASGPMRAAVVSGERKLVLFNRAEAFAPADPTSAHLWRLDLDRLEDAELYDLAADPGERTNLWLAEPGEPERATAALGALLHRELDAHGGGLRVVASGLVPGAKADVTIRFDPSSQPPAVAPYFLGPEDRFATGPGFLRLRMVGDGSLKGVVVQAPLEGPLSVTVEGLPGILAGDATRMASGTRIAADALRAKGWPPGSGAAALYLWIPASPGLRSQNRDADAETLARLRALGYVE